MTTPNLTVGTKVRIEYPGHRRHGKEGKIKSNDRSSVPYLVEFPDGVTRWYYASQVQTIETPTFGRLPVGAKVRVISRISVHRAGQEGTLEVDDKETWKPYLVRFSDGRTAWYNTSELTAVPAPSPARIPVGAKVRVTVPQGSGRRVDGVGTLDTDDRSGYLPYRVVFQRGISNWYSVEEVCLADAPAASAETPLLDAIKAKITALPANYGDRSTHQDIRFDLLKDLLRTAGLEYRAKPQPAPAYDFFPKSA